MDKVLNDIHNILNKHVYWESGWCTYDELKSYYDICKHIKIHGVDMTLKEFKQILRLKDVSKGVVTIDGKQKRIWENIAPIDSDRG